MRRSVGVDQIAPAAPAHPAASGSAGIGADSPNDVYPVAMSRPAAGSNAVRVSLSGVRIRSPRNLAHGCRSPARSRAPRMRNPVLLYE